MSWSFLLESAILGAGLAMDAFSASLANALKEPEMGFARGSAIAGTFAAFQIAMPLIGWLCVHTLASHVTALFAVTPWIALVLLLWIGGKMLYDGVRHGGEEQPAVGAVALLGQGVATSIDALSVGFVIADHNWPMALLKSVIIGAVTFLICWGGLYAGKRGSRVLEGRAGILGGLILIAIGIRIFISGIA